MKLLTFIFLLLVSFCQKNDYQNDIHKKLIGIDSILISKPELALMRLKELSYNGLSKENRAYYSLLLTIAEDKNSKIFVNDSLISQSVKWYEASSDLYNRARSYTYNGIIRYQTNHRDSLTYSLFKKAESLYQKNKLNNTYEGILYIYLGRLNKHDRNYSLAEKYYLKGADVFLSNNDSYNYIINLIDIIWVKMGNKDLKNVDDYIKKFDKFDSIPLPLRANVFNVKSLYYASKGDYRNAVTNTILNINSNNDLTSRDNQYYSLSIFYLKLGMRDSALFYANKSVNVISDTTATSKYILFKHLADIQALNGEFEAAYTTYNKAYQFHQKYLDELTSKRILELEKKYNLEAKEYELNMANQKNKELIIMILGLSIIFVLLVIILWFKIRITRKEYYIVKQRDELHTKIAEHKLKKMRVINELLSISNSVLPKFKEEYVKIANEKYGLSPDLYSDLLNLAKDFQKRQMDQLNMIINEEISECMDYLPKEFISGLSRNEKILFFLYEEGYQLTQIAEILNTTPNSLRTSRLRLVQKLQASEFITDEIRKNLVVLSRE